VTELLELDSVAVRRGAAEVLNGVSFGVRPGEVVAILGSNGVGKSTTLRTISGLHRPHHGRITFEGNPIAGLPPRRIVRLGISHVPEGRQLFPSLSVRENLEMGAYIWGRRSQRDDFDSVLATLPDLAHMLDRRAGSLSGGQQQMVAIARGVMSRPKLLILDEPSLGLAPQVTHSIGELMSALKADGLSVLLVEQNANLALSVADRGHVMVHGRLTLSGSAAELKADDEVRRMYLGT
jgi:branched-chain amino acid transport system ATP-binding protein